MKHLYKGIILLCIFIGSLYYFGQGMKEESFKLQKTTQMKEASFPVVRLRTGEKEMNLLHGYSSNLDANIVRECITPLNGEQSFDVVIDEKENEVKRVIYELRSIYDDELLESDTINALEKEGDQKIAKIKLKTALQEGREYAVKITLVTSESKKMNYYTRVKLIPDSYCKEKIDFAMNFHDSIMDKKTAENVIIYLEPDGNADTSSLAYVNIHSSFDLVSWGNLKPVLMGEIVPTVKEINGDMASIELKYMISAKTGDGTEYYYVKEFYRVKYTSSRMYLLNYERTMEAAFDMNLASLSRSEFKIGITNQTDMDLVTSSDHNKVAFVRQRELWYYDLAENAAVKVFSFRQKNTDYVRDTYGEHDVRILSMDDAGNIDFIVFGYMNRGVYEGRVGIVLYKFYSGENRIEEQVYIPMNMTYQMLKEELGDFSYVNKNGTFYFTINSTIYAYSLITKELSVIASDIADGDYVVSKEEHYIVWQNSSDPTKSDSIVILDLESGEEKEIKAQKGDNINLLGKTEDNIIYGYVKTTDIVDSVDGSTLVPMYEIDIADKDLNLLKEYKKPGYYITGVTVQDNIISLDRKTKEIQDGKISYKGAFADSILNQVTEKKEAIRLTKRVTKKTLTEYYISFPAGFTMAVLPKLSSTVNTIITRDTTLRLDEKSDGQRRYTVYAVGDIKGIFYSAGEAINLADTWFGCVIDNKQQTIWERGIKNTASEIDGISPIYTDSATNSVTAAAKMIINYHNGTTKFDNTEKNASAYQLLKKNLGDSVLNLTGCSLDEVLYYVSNKIPILAMKDSDDAVLITGYDAYNITVIDPKLHTVKKIGMNDAMESFLSAGNIFVGYRADNR